jgi:hypothetical protein
MRKNGIFRVIWCYTVIVSLLMSSCVSRKKKGEVSKLSKFYHNVTSEYNGYFNADELYSNSMNTLVDANEDNYSKIIELYDYISVPDPKVVNADLDKAIEKVTRVAALHQKGDWVDDCYVLMAKSQYLKQDYEKAEETLEFFEEEYNPTNPYGKNFKKKKPTAKERKRAAEELKKERAEETKERKKLQEEEREVKKEAAEKAREEKAEANKAAKEARERATEQARKDKEQKAELAKKAREQASSEAKAQQALRDQEAKRQKEEQEVARKKAEADAKALDNKQETTNESRREAAQRRIDERKKQIEEARANNLAKREQGKKASEDVAKANEAIKTTTEPTTKTDSNKPSTDKKEEEVAITTPNKKEEGKPTKVTPTKEVKKDEKKEVKKDAKKDEEIADNEEKKEDKKKKDDKKKEEDKSKYNEALLWLARTYIKRENFSGAEFTLRQLEEKTGLSKDVQELLPVAFAELAIKQKEYKDALPFLDEAIKIARKKNHKARYAYVAGQLMETFKNPSSAASYYSTAQKNAKDFKLKFMSTLAIAKMDAASGGKSPEQVVASISKFLKESKYDDLRDQIYFSMGEIIGNTNKAKAKEYFANSSIENIGNKSLKGEACYRMAELELSDKNFSSAKLYYDTTLSNINSFDDRYYYVKNMSSNLAPIASNVMKVERADSLLALAKLSDNELKKWAKNRIKEGIEPTTTDSDDVKPNSQRKSNLITARTSANVNSNFFAYNPANTELGKTSFKILWGDRKNEDNWRRSVKSYQAGVETASTTTTTKGDSQDSDLADNEKIKAAISSVPRTVEQQERLRTEKKTALFELGKDFREKLKEYQLSVDALEQYFKMTVGSDAVDVEKLPEAMYIAFMDYNDLNQSGLATAMKGKMAEKFPNDKYSKLANDPSFLASLNADAKTLDKFYEQTLDLFNKADYAGVIARVEKAMEDFGKENKFVPKFHLLNAMSLGATQGKEFYIKSLQELIQRYPKTEEETKAKEILRFLNGDGSAFKEVDVKEVDDTFLKDENTRHYIAVVVMSFDADALEKAKISISDYNKQYHRSDNLQYGESALSQSESTQIILIRSFENMAKAKIYYDGAMRSKKDYVSNVGIEILPISQANYRKMMAAKTHSTYRAYFEKNYLK